MYPTPRKLHESILLKVVSRGKGDYQYSFHIKRGTDTFFYEFCTESLL